MSNPFHQSGASGDAHVLRPEIATDAAVSPGLNGGDYLAITGKAQLDAALQCFRAMDGTSGHTGGAPDPFKVDDWTNVNAATTYGLSNDAGGYTINRIPGLDGETYSYRFNKVMDGISQHVYKLDANGNDVEVTDQRLLMEIARKANLIHRVDAGQQLLATKTDGQRETLDKLVDALKNDDPKLMGQLIQEYAQDGGNFKDFCDAFEAAATIHNAPAFFVYQPNDDSQSLIIRYTTAQGTEKKLEISSADQ